MAVSNGEPRAKLWAEGEKVNAPGAPRGIIKTGNNPMNIYRTLYNTSLL